MGAKPSSIAELQTNELLNQLAGAKKIAKESAFWNELLSFSFAAPLERYPNQAQERKFITLSGSWHRTDLRLLEEAVAGLCKKFAINNKLTGNFTMLCTVFSNDVQVLIQGSKNAELESSETCRKAHNALLLIRCFCKYFVENLPESELIAQFNTLPTCSGTTTVFEDFLLSSNLVISNVVARKTGYFLHLEVINTLLVLLSIQMSELRPVSSSPIFLDYMNSKCADCAPQVVRRLFHHYIRNDPPPEEANSVGLLSWTMTSIWSLFGSSTPSEEPQYLHPLSTQSALLLLVLANQLTRDRNPYRAAIFSCKALDKAAKGPKSGEAPVAKDSTVNFHRLFQALCRDLDRDCTILLLYTLLHRNENFTKHLLQRDDLGILVIPLLEFLYHAEHQNAHHIYMVLIVILILTQEEKFNHRVHQTIIPAVPWFKERALVNVTLGGLLILVVIRTIHCNMIKMRDKYLHTNCLATLANMSSYFDALHPYVTQRLVSLFEQLCKRQLKASERCKGEFCTEEELSDLAVLEEIIRMVLEIINSCLTNTMQHNPNLIYSLLHKRELFDNFRTHDKFQDIMLNIDTVLAYFGSKLSDLDYPNLSVDDVLNVIREGLENWPKDKLQKYPPLRFKYMEEDQPEEFFVPYVWSLVYKWSHLYWNAEKISLFQPSRDNAIDRTNSVS